MKTKLLIPLSILTFTLIITSHVLKAKSNNYVKINNKTIKAEIAKSNSELQKGLMHRKSLCKDCGMFFIFKKPTHINIWMKNTLIPLDIIFIDSNLVVTGIHHAAPCKTQICKKYSSTKKTKYVLEVNKNTFNKDIIGQKITHSKNLITVDN